MKKKVLRSAGALLLACLLLYVLIGTPMTAAHGRALEQAIRALPEDTKTVSLNETVPFAWDTVYTFAPYTDRETIEAAIGFSSPAIRETVNEGMVQLIFVKGRTVTASICGYADALGYEIVLPGASVSREDNASCSVSRAGGVVTLRVEQPTETVASPSA